MVVVVVVVLGMDGWERRPWRRALSGLGLFDSGYSVSLPPPRRDSALLDTRPFGLVLRGPGCATGSGGIR